MRKRELCTEIPGSHIVCIATLNHRVVGVLHLPDGATLAIPDVETVHPDLLPGVARQETGKDARIAAWVLYLDHVALAVSRISCGASVDGHTDWYVPELSCVGEGWK